MLGLFGKKADTKTNEIEKIKTPEDFEHVEMISDFFKSETGVNFDNQKEILKSKLITFCRQREITSFALLLKRTKDDKYLKEELINYLTTNESYFYREFKQIEQLLISIKSKQKPVSILCAPSATGEEPYSIAMALLNSGIQKNEFSILGIDINTQALHKATEGVYGEKSIKSIPKDVIDKYFKKDDQKYHLNSEIKSQVSFKVINIFDDEFLKLPKFDYIFCRNMLIYFDMPTKKRAKERLERLLKDSAQPIFFGHADLF